MTLDEFDAADYRPGFRYELIHGVLVVTPPPLVEERDGNEELGRLLRNYQEWHPQGKALDLTLPEHNVRTKVNNRRCDRAIWAGLGRIPRTKGPARRNDVPTIIVEFPSAGRRNQLRDYVEKRDEYRDLGIREYWIIDRFSHELVVYRWHGRRWLPQTFDAKAVYTTPILPGFELSLTKLFGIADRHPPGEDDEYA
jgi:Uma2 family endonuclease